MQQTKKKNVLCRMLVACLSLAMVLTLFAMPALADEKEQKMCKISVSHDTSANVEGQAYNTLQLYLNGGDYHDIQDGEELPAGSEVCYFVTAYASDMQTTVVHNGETVEDFVTPCGEQGEEHSLTLAGDLSITTKVVAAEQKYTISFENKVDNEKVQFNVRSLVITEEGPLPVEIKNGDTVSKGQYVGVQVLNGTEQKLRLNQLDASGKVVNTEYIDPAVGEEEGAGGINCFEGVTTDTKFILDVAPETFKVKVTNGAASVNTDSNVNGLHVYDNSPGSSLDDIEGEVELEKGTPVEIYAYPTASAIHMKVVHNGETIFDKNLPRMTAWVDDDKIEWITIDSLEGELEVTTEAISSYEVNIEDKVQSKLAVFTVATVDYSEGVPKQVVLSDGDSLFEGDMAAARVVNDTDKLLKLSAVKNSDGSVIDEVLVLPGNANGIYIMEMDSSVKFTLEESKEKIAISSIVLKNTSKTYTGKAIRFDDEITVKAVINGEKVTLKQGTDYTVKYTNNVNAGKTAKVTVTGKGFFGGSKSKSFTITAKKVTPSVSVTKSFVYNGNVRKPAVTVKAEGKLLKNGTDYTVTYAKGRKAVGTYKIAVKLKGNYSGSKTVSFKIVPKSTAITKVTGAAKGFSVTWNKQTAQTSGYQVQYSLKKDFSSGNKVVTVSGSAKNLAKVSGLKSGKTYYVHVRTFKTVGGTKYYSDWSAAKAVRTK